MSGKTTIDRILELKAEYETWSPTIGDQIDPMAYPELLRIRKELACASLDLAMETSESTRAMIRLEGEIEFNRYQKQHQLITDEVKIGAAEAHARSIDKEKKAELHVAKGTHKVHDMLLKQVNEILFSLRQEISIVKKEYESYANQ